MTWLPTSRRDDDTRRGSTAAGGLAQAVTSLEKYRVLSELGRGGMANVSLAVTRGPGAVSKLVVLKALLPDLATEPDALTAFLEEARLAAQLNHGNVVQTYEVGTQGDQHVIVMEYLEGQTLGDVIRRGTVTGNPLSLAFQLRIIISVLEGLQYAHELCAYDGLPLMLVHRDVSPQNVFVTYDGQVKVLDFGIAKAKSSTINTATGMIKGKISYMSPEQMFSEGVDHRADVYSVGCMLWAAAAG
ncbi:MAG TPA: serine/threonine-protein kinase, partial [Polyangiaceae bacterium]